MCEKNLDFYTVAEYIAVEKTTNIKHEYRAGNIVALAGGSLNHGLISFNAAFELRDGINKNKKQCTVINSDIKIYIKEANHFVYPDAGAVCGKIEASDKDKNAITNPILVIEVLSPSTADYDRGGKFKKYRTLPSLQEYIVIHQDKPEVETYYKGDKGLWTIGPAILGLDKVVEIRSMGFDIAMAKIYHGIENLDSPQTKLDL